MKVAYVCHRYYPYIGGVQTRVKEISENLVNKGYEVKVLTTDPSKNLLTIELVGGVVVKRFKCWAPNDAYYFSRGLKKYLEKNSNNYDVVHAHGYSAFPALYAAQTKKMNRLIFTPHYHEKGHTLFRNLLHVPYKFVAKKIFKKSERIVCVSNYEKSLIMNKFEICEEKIAVIPNGVNLEEFRGLEKRKGDRKVILYVGRLEGYKGVHYLIKVLSKLDDEIVLEIVGKGLFKDNLVKLTKRLGVERRVEFYQDMPRNNLLQKYVDADLFVLLSKYEAYSISVAEALASKTPCIVANTSALKEWVDDECCFGVDYPINIDKLADVINKVIGKEVKTVELWSWEKVAKELERIYKQDACMWQR